MLVTRPVGARWLGLAGATTIVAGAALVVVLHVREPSVSPVRRTISEYALLDHAWLFNAAVFLVAAGSLVTLLALVRTDLLRPLSVASLALAVWCAALVGVVAFPKHNWAVGPSVSGEVHRGLSLAAFVSLPLAAVLVGWAGRTVGGAEAPSHWVWCLCLPLRPFRSPTLPSRTPVCAGGGRFRWDWWSAAWHCPKWSPRSCWRCGRHRCPD